MNDISIVIPARNESEAIVDTIRAVQAAFKKTDHACEIIVVDDCSTDMTRSLAEETGVRVITHPTNKGYGNALLTGIRNARHPWIAITDADGTYPVEVIPQMLAEAAEHDYDMLVGARQGTAYYQSAFKATLRFLFKTLCQFVVGQSIPDINSGLRVIRRELIAPFSPVLSGGFSFTTSITIVAFQTGHHVAYVPVDYLPRKGKSHVNLFRDSLRALQIVVMTIVLFNPIKLYLLQTGFVAVVTFFAAGFLLLFPSTFPLLLLLGLGFCTANLLLAMGFQSIRSQIGVGEIIAPKRGYVPRDNGKEPDHVRHLRYRPA